MDNTNANNIVNSNINNNSTPSTPIYSLSWNDWYIQKRLMYHPSTFQSNFSHIPLSTTIHSYLEKNSTEHPQSIALCWLPEHYNYEEEFCRYKSNRESLCLDTLSLTYFQLYSMAKEVEKLVKYVYANSSVSIESPSTSFVITHEDLLRTYSKSDYTLPTVIIISSNTWQRVVAYYGCLMAGLIVCMLDENDIGTTPSISHSSTALLLSFLEQVIEFINPLLIITTPSFIASITRSSVISKFHVTSLYRSSDAQYPASSTHHPGIQHPFGILPVLVLESVPSFQNDIDDMMKSLIFHYSLCNHQSPTHPPIITTSLSPAHIIFTSGTTNDNRKAILTTHQSSILSHLFRLDIESSSISQHSSSFSSHNVVGCNIFGIWDIVASVIAGKSSTAFLLSPFVIHHPFIISFIIRRFRITKLMLTPSLLHMSLSDAEFLSLFHETSVSNTHHQSFNCLPSSNLSCITLCGEPVTATLLSHEFFQSFHVLPASSISHHPLPTPHKFALTLINLYSSSECHDISASAFILYHRSSHCTPCNIFSSTEIAPSPLLYNVGYVAPFTHVFIGKLMLTSTEPESSPISNQRHLLIQLAPIGYEGQVFITGQGLAVGYYVKNHHNNHNNNHFFYISYNNSIANNNKVIIYDRKQGDSIDINSSTWRVYNSGDKGMFDENGSLKITGRWSIDDEWMIDDNLWTSNIHSSCSNHHLSSTIKLNGQFINVSEIETLLLRLVVVEDVCILLKNNEIGLVMFVVPKDKCIIQDLSQVLQFRKQLFQHFLKYASSIHQSSSTNHYPPSTLDNPSFILAASTIPKYYHLLKQLPINPISGKLDKKKLLSLPITPWMIDIESSLTDEFSMHSCMNDGQDKLQNEIINLMIECLPSSCSNHHSLSSFSATSNFYYFGGTSIGALKFVIRIKNDMGLFISIRSLNRDPTPRGVFHYICDHFMESSINNHRTSSITPISNTNTTTPLTSTSSREARLIGDRYCLAQLDSLSVPLAIDESTSDYDSDDCNDSFSDDDDDNVDDIKSTIRHPSTVIILTGSTGFIGSRILRALLLYNNKSNDIKNDESNTQEDRKSLIIYCIIRSSRQKLYQQLLALGISSYIIHHPSSFIRIIHGDLSKPFLGRSQAKFNYVSAQIVAMYQALNPLDNCNERCGIYIIHGGADVSLSSSLAKLSPTNVGGTNEMIRLALTIKRLLHIQTYRKDSEVPEPRFIYLSSTAVEIYGECLSIVETPSQTVNYIQALAQSSLTSNAPRTSRLLRLTGYAQSKHCSEELLARIGLQTGLKSFIYRVGNVVDNTFFNPDNKVLPYQNWQTIFIRCCLLLGSVPSIESTEEAWEWFVFPVTSVINDILSLIHCHSPSGERYPLSSIIYHPSSITLCHCHNFAVINVYKVLDHSLSMNRVSLRVWVKYLIDMERNCVDVDNKALIWSMLSIILISDKEDDWGLFLEHPSYIYNRYHRNQDSCK